MREGAVDIGAARAAVDEIRRAQEELNHALAAAGALGVTHEIETNEVTEMQHPVPQYRVHVRCSLDL